MCKATWPSKLKQTLNRHQSADNDKATKIAIVGIGNEFAGDDIAGISVVRKLPATITRDNENLLVIDAGPAPENCTGLLRRFVPDLVLLVDAARMDEPPGTICWLSWQETTGLSASTHTLPPYVLAQYLIDSLECEVALIGVQPADMEIDQGVSPEVQRAIDSIVETLTETLA